MCERTGLRTFLAPQHKAQGQQTGTEHHRGHWLGSRVGYDGYHREAVGRICQSRGGIRGVDNDIVGHVERLNLAA